ncbi:MAG: serine/threonine-protein kinase [Dongiaceae bacterium]
MLRAVIGDAVGRLLRPAAPKRAPAPAPAVAPAPVSSASAATMLTPSAAAPQAPVQSVTGTHFLPSQSGGPQVPRHIGRYEILTELGHGAMGTVYKAQDPKIGRTVAIKTISAVGMGPEMEQYRARFLIEAKSAGRLTHPGIVAVHDVADDEAGRPCLVLEFVEGTTLDRLTADAPMPLPQALDIVAQIARALGYAHEQGIVHRDVKPANIMVTASGQAKLSDFGIAKIEGTTLTIAGQILGTPAFMSPEQCTGHGVDYRSDIFSLGAVLYTLVARTKPFPGETFTSVAYKVVHTDHVPARQLNPDLPAELDKIISRCLAKDPASRYPSATTVAEDLEALRRGTLSRGGEAGAAAEARGA